MSNDEPHELILIVPTYLVESLKIILYMGSSF